ncbi:hypothetical protein ACFYY2_31600 [Streptomyces sp. NPDC001822]|uniref:hypothetical protein n=1 Tax=Streptomyces sp. NPDC001822 TaxID=3364614 RepID=UPI00369ACD94
MHIPIYPHFPTIEPKGGRTIYGVVVTFSNDEGYEVGEWVGDPRTAGKAAIAAYLRHHRSAYVEVMLDGTSFAYVTHHPRTHEKTPFLCQVGMCADDRCGEVPPEKCLCKS